MKTDWNRKTMSSSSRNLRHSRPSKRVSKDPPLFADVKAWFSSSVSHEKKLAWIKHGGQCGDWQEAQLLFSEDVNAKDTKALFEQMEFLWGYVTIFNAAFITACVKAKDMKTVAMATYLMLPPEYPLVDTKDVPSSSSHTTVPTTRLDHPPDRDDQVRSVIVRHSSRRRRRLQLSKRSLQSLSSARIKNNPRHQPCNSCEKSFQFCHGVECAEETSVPYCDLSSIPHVNSLKQTSLPLSDFIPGQDGCTVSRKV